MNTYHTPALQRLQISGEFPFSFDQKIPKGTVIQHAGGSLELPYHATLTLKSPLGGNRFEVELQELGS